jgi:UDP-galactopyranose mutase
MAYDFVVVGAGMFGASFARTVAERGKKCLVIDKKDHVGGACYTEEIAGVHVHKYGPHIFHTDNLEIWSWIQRFGKFIPCTLRSKARYKGTVYSLPFNLMTFQQLWGVTTPEEAKRKLDSVRVKDILEPQSIEEWALSQLGEEIYQKLVYGYTKKQWGREPNMLAAPILKRLPIRLTFDDNYFRDIYQGVPIDGYTNLFHRMLDHYGIEVRLGCDFFEDRAALTKLGQVVYSGRVDQLFGYRYGDLEFRTLRFETKTVEGDFQGVPLVYYTEEEVPYTRTMEHKHFHTPHLPRGPLTWEYPEECGRDAEAFYPINDRKNNDLAQRYLRTKSSEIVGGRQGTYKYVDMHQVIAQAWKLANKLIS